jgi:DNA-binding response OmpR family regulator
MDHILDIHGGHSERAQRRISTGGHQRARGSSRVADVAATTTPRHRLAVLDSDSGFLLVLGKRLELAGWGRETLTKKVSAKKIAALDVEALIVDAELLGAGRMAWLRSVCDLRPDLCVIVCTASSTVVERVGALRFGVDDWMSKPCHPEELVARMEVATMHRRRNTAAEADPVRIGEIEIRPDRFQAFVGEESLGLTRREYQLLGLLCEAGGTVLPRTRIYECLWGYEMVRNDRSVDVFVHKLRRKIEQHSPGWSYIHTHFGVGYRLAPERVVVDAEPLAA